MQNLKNLEFENCDSRNLKSEYYHFNPFLKDLKKNISI